MCQIQQFAPLLVLHVDVVNDASWQMPPSELSLHTERQNDWSCEFHSAIIKLTAISHHSNQTIMNFQKQLTRLSCRRTFMKARKTALSPPLIRAPSSRGVTSTLLHARNPFRRPQPGLLINTHPHDND